MVAKKSISKIISVMLALTFLLVQASPVLATPGTTVRVSINSTGTGGNSASTFASISANDGQYVAFQSDASNLVADDTNGVSDIFVRDTVANTTTRVSVNSIGQEVNGASSNPCISADGHYVVFQSDATNLVDDDTNGFSDIFMRDTWANTTSRLSLSSSGVPGNSNSYAPSISADGQFVAFELPASTLVTGDTNGTWDIYVRDTVGNTTTRASVDLAGVIGNSHSRYPVISADGGFVSFVSNATNLVEGDGNGIWDIFVNNQSTGETERVTVDLTGEEANATSVHQSISGDGRYVAFESGANNLVDQDTNGTTDIFIRDTLLDTTTRISLSSSGAQANYGSQFPSISADGGYVAFKSAATNLVEGDTNTFFDIFVRDLGMNTTRRVSLHSSGAQGNSTSDRPSISTYGSLVAFESSASNLVVGDTNSSSDIFVRDTGVDLINNTFAQIASTLLGYGIVSNIGNVTASNWTSFPDLYFEKRTNVADPETAIGKITFNSPIDFSNPATQAFLQFLGTKLEISTGRIAFDARNSPNFAATSATLVMYHLPSGITFEQLTVRDDMDIILDASTIVSGFTQNPVTGDVTFNVAHFTQFVIENKIFLPLLLR